MLDGPPKRVKSKKRLTAVETDEALRGQNGMKKVYGLDQGRKIQALFPPRLITIGALKIASVRQYDG